MVVLAVVCARKFIFIIHVLKLFLNNGDNVYILGLFAIDAYKGHSLQHETP